MLLTIQTSSFLLHNMTAQNIQKSIKNVKLQVETGCIYILHKHRGGQSLHLISKSSKSMHHWGTT